MPKRELGPLRPSQLRTPRRLDCQTSGRRKNTNSFPLMPVNTASVNSAEPVAHGSVSHRIGSCGTFKNRLLSQVMLLHPCFVQRRSPASRYRCPGSRRVWSAGRWGTRPLFFRAGRRPPLPQLNSASVTSTVDSLF